MLFAVFVPGAVPAGCVKVAVTCVNVEAVQRGGQREGRGEQGGLGLAPKVCPVDACQVFETALAFEGFKKVAALDAKSSLSV